MAASFVVGIDLGTSNTVVAAASLADPRPEIVRLVQRTGPQSTEPLELLSSHAYRSIEGELSPIEGLGETDEWTIGAFAKKRASEVPARAIVSSKSWLCHPRVDKEANILPWGAPEDVPKLSPVDVARRILSAIRSGWDRMHPDAPLSAQDVVLTVPASFDDVARELTMRAAKSARLSVRLLEEPQAAFYRAMDRGALEAVRGTGETVAHVLVVDVGGGTTDLSLLEVRADGHRVKRIAVGAHLLLGGDNMDLAIAHLLEKRIDENGLDPLQFSELVTACRAAKERLLSEKGPTETPVTLLARGSKLLGGTKSTELGREEVSSLVVEGFFPMLTERERPAARARAGLVAIGLPFERDVAITRHIASFLTKHLPEGARVDALLLNGGVFNAARIRDRVVEATTTWQGAPPVVLPADEADLAVALGAARYGLALRGLSERIEGGATKTYFVGMGRNPKGAPLAVMVIPKGCEEGTRTILKDRPMKLVVGRPARFDVFTNDDVGPMNPGELVTIEGDAFQALPPLATRVPSDKPGEIPVHLEAEVTAIGTLEIACVAVRDDGEDRHVLTFELQRPAEDAPPSTIAPKRPSENLDRALDAIGHVYGKNTSSDAKDAKNLQRDLEKLLGDRDMWSADTSRALADRLLEQAKGRRRTADHERVWLQLVGFVSRPGFGAPGDDDRAKKMSAVFSERVGFPTEVRTWQQFFICGRRIAGGLDEAAQISLRSELDPLIAPSEARLKKPKLPKPEGIESDLLDLLSALERAPSARRAELGGWILERTWTKRDPRLWAALGKLGARVPSYASAHHAIPVGIAEKWLRELLGDQWKDLPTAPKAASELARLTGDRSRDVSASLRAETIARLRREGASPGLIEVVESAVPVREADRIAFFGERLPSGLRLE